jgi:hypothetical protein
MFSPTQRPGDEEGVSSMLVGETNGRRAFEFEKQEEELYRK